MADPLFFIYYFLVRFTSAGLNDLEKLMTISERFFRESDFRFLTYDPDMYRHCLTQALIDPTSDIIVAWDGDEIVGYVTIFCIREYTKETIGEMYQFYILPEYRGKGVSRGLVDKVEQRFNDWNCAVSYVSCDPRIQENNNNKLFSNLWKKFGYQETGINLTKDRHGKFL